MTKGALLSITADVTLADGTVKRVSTNSWDLVVVERALGRIGVLVTGEPSIEETFRLVHAAARRAGFAGDDFDAWMAEVEIDPVEPGDDEDPKDGGSRTATT